MYVGGAESGGGIGGKTGEQMNNVQGKRGRAPVGMTGELVGGVAVKRTEKNKQTINPETKDHTIKELDTDLFSHQSVICRLRAFYRCS